MGWLLVLEEGFDRSGWQSGLRGSIVYLPKWGKADRLIPSNRKTRKGVGGRFFLTNPMSVPKQRHTKGRSDRKRVQYMKTAKELQKCPKCQAVVLSHRACSTCGSYHGREYLDTVNAKLEKHEAEA